MTRTDKKIFEKYVQLVDNRVRRITACIDKYESDNDSFTATTFRTSGIAELDAIKLVAIHTLENSELRNEICDYINSKWQDVLHH